MNACLWRLHFYDHEKTKVLEELQLVWFCGSKFQSQKNGRFIATEKDGKQKQVLKGTEKTNRHWHTIQISISDIIRRDRINH